MPNEETITPLMPEFAWDGDRLTTTDEAKIKKIVRKNLSASASNSLRGCTARFAADSVLPRMDDPFSPAELGTGAHAVLEELYALPEAERTEANIIRLSLELADKEWTPDKLSRHTVSTNSVNGQVKQEWEQRVRAMALGDLVLEDPTKVDVFQPEWALKGVLLPVPDGRVIPMIGFIDRTDFTPEGKLAIRDYKSGKYKAPNPRFSDDYGDQLRIYTVTAETVLQDPELREEHFNETQLMRLDEAGHYSVDDAKLLYIAAGKERTIDINRRALDVTMDGFARSWDTMQAAGEAGEFKATPGALCGWCPLANSCPVATVKTDKARDAAATQPTAVMLGIPTVRPSGTPANVVESKKTESVPVSNGTSVSAPRTAVQKEGKMPLLPSGARYAEDSSYKEFVNYPDGARPNLNSYGFGGATGLTSLAFELLSEQNAVSSQRIISLSVTLGKLIWLVERRVANSAFNWNHGLHTRLRGDLRTFIAQHPLPVNGTDEDWKTWIALAADHMTDLLVVTYQLVETDFNNDTRAYAYLASDGDMAPHVDLPRRFLPDGVAYVEGKVYDESALYPDGSRPNINSHGFAGASGIVSEAYRLLHESNELDYTASNLIALSATLGHVIWRAEAELVDAFSWHHGLNTRLRGFLFSIIQNSSPTLNQPTAAWSAWADRVAGQLQFLAETSYSLYNTDFANVQEPYAPLTAKTS
jgi:putative RecB family exonuclease